MSKASQQAVSHLPLHTNKEWVNDIWKQIEKRNDTLQGITQDATPADIDQKFAEEINALSLNERNERLESIHGVAKEVEETPELVALSVDGVERALADDKVVPPETKAAYLLAKKQDPDYVRDPRFVLMFLRPGNFDVVLAAKRMALFFEKKQKFFGTETLTRSLRLTDLTKDQRTTLKNGSWQALPSRDRCGRLVVFDLPLCGPQLYTTLEDQLICIAYSFFTLVEDSDTQKHGMVYVMWHIGKFRNQDREPRNSETISELLFLNRWAPIRCRGAHLCIDHDPMKKVLAEIHKVTIPTELRPYFRVHQGSPTEVLYSLMPFGIPVDQFPLSSQGEIKCNNQVKWISKRRVKEQSMESKIGWTDPRIDLPTHKDILLGKGKPIQNHHGNQQFRFVIEQSLARHMKSSLTEKAAITWNIVKQVKDSDGRFLKKAEGGWWVEASDNEARGKVAFTFSNALAAFKRGPFGKKGSGSSGESGDEEDSKTASITDDSSSSNGRSSRQLAAPPLKRLRKAFHDSSSISDIATGCFGKCIETAQSQKLLWGRETSDI